MSKWYVCGTNSMGSTWYLSNKDARECILWSGAPKEYRATYDNKEEALEKAKELDVNFQFGTTRHRIKKVEEE